MKPEITFTSVRDDVQHEILVKVSGDAKAARDIK